VRGWGAPSHETATESLTRPDWGWGDDAPTSWDATTLDYGWGSDHGAAFPSYLELETRAIGDDGGYAISIVGDFPRRGASRFQRPTGFEVVLVDAQSVEHQCHSGLFGQGEQCSTNIPARILRAYSPALDVGAYDVVVRYDGTEQNVGTINARRRARTAHEYDLRAALPSAYKTGVRRMELDSVLDTSAPSAVDEVRSTLETLTRVVAQSLAELNASGAITRLTAAYSGGSTLHVESTLGFADSGAVWLDGERVAYTSKNATTLSGVDAPRLTASRGSRVTHDPHSIAD